MALSIKENNGIFLLEGSINNATVKQFKSHLEFLILYKKSVTIDINAISAIDKIGLQAIHDLFSIAATKNKVFDIIGYGCKAIYESIAFEYAA